MFIRNADLFSIASTGINASNRLINTTGHNIANVNTEGYVRERTEFTARVGGGVSGGIDRRIIDIFAQNQLRRDTTQFGEFDAYTERVGLLDNLFAGEANSLSGYMDRFFASMQTAADDPTSMAARQLVLSEAQSMVGQMSRMSEFLQDKQNELNAEVEILVNEANDLIQTIADLNNNIRVTGSNNTSEIPNSLLTERDVAIQRLAEIVSIEVRDSTNSDGTVMVNLTSGESLVLEDSTFNLFQLNGDPDLNHKEIELQNDDKPINIGITGTELSGRLGGLYRYRDEVLEPNIRELGQISAAMAESVNQQNRLGMDFDEQLGIDVFSLPEFVGLNYADNADPLLSMQGRYTSGKADEFTSADYQITIDGTTSGTPDTVDITIALLNSDGSPVTDISGNPITQSYTGLEAASGVFSEVLGGLELEFADGASYTAGDRFLLQPSKSAANNIEVSMTRPEDLALASPLILNSNDGNLGDASVSNIKITNTLVDLSLANPLTSAFDGAGGLLGPGAAPGGGVGSPVQIRFTAADEYEVLDSGGTVITTVSGVTDLENLLEKAALTPGWPAAWGELNDFPGYDLSLQGVPQAGDVFDLSYNTGGINDNRNGLALADLQNTDTMLLNNNGTSNLVTFHEAYSTIVADIGGKSASAQVSLRAAEAMQEQSRSWFESVAGVNLDEEAANLVRFQQSYAASARILGAAQDMFNTILSSTQ
jgi:flagellar hook-associated protein 1 FlgK